MAICWSQFWSGSCEPTAPTSSSKSNTRMFESGPSLPRACARRSSSLSMLISAIACSSTATPRGNHPTTAEMRFVKPSHRWDQKTLQRMYASSRSGCPRLAVVRRASHSAGRGQSQWHGPVGDSPRRRRGKPTQPEATALRPLDHRIGTERATPEDVRLAGFIAPGRRIDRRLCPAPRAGGVSSVGKRNSTDRPRKAVGRNRIGRPSRGINLPIVASGNLTRVTRVRGIEDRTAGRGGIGGYRRRAGRVRVGSRFRWSHPQVTSPFIRLFNAVKAKTLRPQVR